MVATQSAKPIIYAAKDARFLIVEGRFYDHINNELVAGAREAFEDSGSSYDIITMPGALELPAAIAIALDAANMRHEPYDGVVALGCVIRGETGHYDIVAGESARALMDLSVQRKIPLGNGILTVETEAQALVRANRHEMNKGRGAAEAALALYVLKKKVTL
jgi:6,7-dimethyl-8-ribityllumazine synthase